MCISLHCCVQTYQNVITQDCRFIPQLISSHSVVWFACCTALFGKDKAAKKMLQQLPEVFRQVWYWCGCRYAPLGRDQHIRVMP